MSSEPGGILWEQERAELWHIATESSTPELIVHAIFRRSSAGSAYRERFVAMQG